MANLLAMAVTAQACEIARAAPAADSTPTIAPEVPEIQLEAPSPTNRAQASSGKSRGPSIHLISPLDSSGRTVKVKLIVTGPDGGIESDVECIVLGISNSTAALAWVDPDGLLHVDTVAPAYVPKKTLKQVNALSSRRGFG